jgi:hypothetical protein
MKADLLKYKHYLILLAALLLANYVTVPLWDLQQEQKQALILLNKQVTKIEKLLSGKDNFSQQLKEINKLQESIEPFIFQQGTEAEFKLVAQQQLEALLVESKCNMERVNWLSSTAVNNELTRWRLELRYSGTPACMIKTTRALGKVQPLMRIQDFTFSADPITGQASDTITTMLTMTLFHKPNNSIVEGTNE